MNKNLMAFCFSVKKNTGDAKTCTKEIYEQYIKEITTKYEDIQVLNIYYERDKQYKRLHFHAVLICPKSFLRTKLRRSGWNIHYVPLNDPNAWDQYCKKSQRKNGRIIPTSADKTEQFTIKTESYDVESFNVESFAPESFAPETFALPTESDYEDFSKWVDDNYPWPPKDATGLYTDEYIFSNIEL